MKNEVIHEPCGKRIEDCNCLYQDVTYIWKEHVLSNSKNDISLKIIHPSKKN